MLRNPNTNRLTPEGNSACGEAVREVRKLYENLRQQGFNTEEVYYMISTAAHECVMEEALFSIKITKENK